jgi:hypothetical protein
MLVTIVALFLLTMMGVAGAVVGPGRVFVALYEWILLGTLGEMVLSGFYFAVVTYRVAVTAD